MLKYLIKNHYSGSRDKGYIILGAKCTEISHMLQKRIVFGETLLKLVVVARITY